MWLFNSSIGKKVVMSVTGLALILFLTFHMAMNCVALFSAEGYEWICNFLGANWYAMVGTIGLALLMVIHFVYAFWLTLTNKKARGAERYAVTARPKGVEFASRNMFVLGLCVCGGLVLHLVNFWSKMQLVELMGGEPAGGVELIRHTFSKWYFVLLYLIWLCALWFHLTHGFWSAIQTIGWSNRKWFVRWKWIGYICVTLLILGFVSVLMLYFFAEGLGWVIFPGLFQGLVA
ncbi:MAG: succinate dehydrogenase/fumarate reductase cytochrome b subunit [Bacteroidaceae bacterium]|jgi:succinate dehydrogenase / fumarate reductase cytochrome b subunit|nr:succinate dehydrogenase/fumarate reductase cytochrome b subunit [Bacteroidaceae bacterium]